MTYEKMNERYNERLDELNLAYRDGYIIYNNKLTRIKAENKSTALAHRFVIMLITANLRITEVKKTPNIEDKKKLLIENMKYLNNIMGVLNIKSKYRKVHNRQVEKFGRTTDNPFYISKDQMDNEIDFDKLDDNTLMQLYCKNMHWSNKLTKEIDCIKCSIVLDNQNDVKYRDRLERIVSNVLGSSIKKFPLFTNYCKYLTKEIDSKEFKSTDGYKELKRLVTGDENTKSMKDSMNVVLPYLSLSLIENILYITKNRCIEDIFRIKGKNTKIDVLNDLESRDDRKIISIFINGYNRPYMVHYDAQNSEALAKKYNIEIGDSNNKGTKYLFPYKYTKEQRKKIESLNVKSKDKGDIVNDR